MGVLREIENYYFVTIDSKTYIVLEEDESNSILKIGGVIYNLYEKVVNIELGIKVRERMSNNGYFFNELHIYKFK